jgi:hypothetical protein
VQTEAALRHELDEVRRALALTRDDREHLAIRLEDAERRLDAVEATRVWRVARSYWRARDAVRLAARREAVPPDDHG